MLPDDVLLEISDFYEGEDVDEDYDELEDFELAEKQRTEAWIRLAHVCRRWRSVVFQSSRRLNLRLFCTPRTPVERSLDIWPSLPLIVMGDYKVFGADIAAALERNDRVCQIDLNFYSNLELEDFRDLAATSMQKPFPELTHLSFVLFEDDRSEPVFPDLFLGGTTPRLRSLYLSTIPFPGLTKLLLSATHLVRLVLDDIPRSGYIRPEVMATSLSALTGLEFLCLEFRYSRPRPALESRRPPPPPRTRPILPRLTKIQFKGTSEYLEEILARIDAPRLVGLHITFFND